MARSYVRIYYKGISATVLVYCSELWSLMREYKNEVELADILF
jgi:hypothetical protein